MGVQFHDTAAGQRFYGVTMPEIAKHVREIAKCFTPEVIAGLTDAINAQANASNRLAAAMEEANRLAQQKNVP